VYTIYLNNLHFHAYHGLFDEEKIIGNERRELLERKLHFLQKINAA
jgi:hypothetical protein